MMSQYQNFVRAKLRARELEMTRDRQAEEDLRSSRIAIGETAYSFASSGLKFRKNMLEKNILDLKTDTGEQAFKYKTGGTLAERIKRSVLPTKNDFEETARAIQIRDEKLKPAKMMKVPNWPSLEYGGKVVGGLNAASSAYSALNPKGRTHKINQ